MIRALRRLPAPWYSSSRHILAARRSRSYTLIRSLNGRIPMPSTIAAPKETPAAEKDFLPLQGTDYIEFYVGNAKQAAYFYKTAFGFQSLAYSGPETGTRDRV